MWIDRSLLCFFNRSFSPNTLCRKLNKFRLFREDQRILIWVLQWWSMRNYSLNFIEYGTLGKYSGGLHHQSTTQTPPLEVPILEGGGVFCTGHALSFLGPPWESPIPGGGWVECSPPILGFLTTSPQLGPILHHR